MATNTAALDNAAPPLAWSRQDVEQWLGFRGGRFTRTNGWLTFLMAGIATAATYGLFALSPKFWLVQSFTDRGPTPYIVVFLTYWGLAVLWIKWRKLAYQERALKYDIVPRSSDYVLSVSTVDQVLDNMHLISDDPRNFLLYNRIQIALANLKNLRRVADIDDILRSQAMQDEASLETSYALVRGFIWAVPVLGFIGTVLGLSQAIGAFGNVLESTTEVSEIVLHLKSVTAGLATAFETTLQALVAGLLLQLLLVFLKKREEEFLDQASDYCLRRVVGRLRVMPFEQE